MVVAAGPTAIIDEAGTPHSRSVGKGVMPMKNGAVPPSSSSRSTWEKSCETRPSLLCVGSMAQPWGGTVVTPAAMGSHIEPETSWTIMM